MNGFTHALYNSQVNRYQKPSADRRRYNPGLEGSIHKTPWAISQASSIRFLSCAAQSPAISSWKRFSFTTIAGAIATAGAWCGCGFQRQRCSCCLALLPYAGVGMGPRNRWCPCSWPLSQQTRVCGVAWYCLSRLFCAMIANGHLLGHLNMASPLRMTIMGFYLPEIQIIPPASKV
jgi:hypothetical protein